MKILFVLLVLIPSFAFTQNVSFVTSTDSTFATIQGYGSKDFITSEGYIRYESVIRAYYHDNVLDKYLAQKMEDKEIPLYDAEEVSEKELKKEAERTQLDELDGTYTNFSSPSQIEDLESRIELFRQKRNSGFSAQAAGVGLTAIGLSTGSSEIILLGTIVNAIGWIVNWVAGDALKRNSEGR